jgi:hypothetical protein
VALLLEEQQDSRCPRISILLNVPAVAKTKIDTGIFDRRFTKLGCPRSNQLLQIMMICPNRSFKVKKKDWRRRCVMKKSLEAAAIQDQKMKPAMSVMEVLQQQAADHSAATALIAAAVVAAADLHEAQLLLSSANARLRRSNHLVVLVLQLMLTYLLLACDEIVTLKFTTHNK